MLPTSWDISLIDLNTAQLRKRQVQEVDYVFISAMSVQQTSAREVLALCRRLKTKVVAGGPLFTTGWSDFPEVDHFVLNEAEITLPLFLKDMEQGNLQRIYRSDEWADLSTSPLPRWDLLIMKKYATMGIQYSRGCPFDCEFCDITLLFGRKMRIKNTMQILAELENIYLAGWRDNVFFVDDNFIGNKQVLK